MAEKEGNSRAGAASSASSSSAAADTTEVADVEVLEASPGPDDVSGGEAASPVLVAQLFNSKFGDAQRPNALTLAEVADTLIWTTVQQREADIKFVRSAYVRRDGMGLFSFSCSTADKVRVVPLPVTIFHPVSGLAAPCGVEDIFVRKRCGCAGNQEHYHHVALLKRRDLTRTGVRHMHALFYLLLITL